MSEPANDTSLREHVLTASPLSHLVEPAGFIRFRARPRRWEIHARVDVYLPGVPFRRVCGPLWHARRGCLSLWPGYAWDGVSGCAADTPDTWIAGLGHDLACTLVDGAPLLPGYWRRHALYARLLWTQRPQPRPRRGSGILVDLGREVFCAVRCVYHFVGLIAFNWLWARLGKGDK